MPPFDPLRVVLVAALNLFLTATLGAAQDDSGNRGFVWITVLDDATGRGVPMVELRTTNDLRFYTDSNGIIAINEPGLFGQDVYFHLRSHGYEYPKDGFGFRGKAVKITRGGRAELKIKRINVAERLYRQTGEGIYRDSVLLGESVPIEQPVLNGQVFGQDSVHTTPYRGKLFWIWGDTNRPGYPLGNFGVSGAVSEMPAPRGRGLDPSVGVNLKYFVNDAGFSRPMISSEAVPGPGPKWIGGLTTVHDESGAERLIAKYVRMKNLGETLERGLVMFNDETGNFDRIVQFNLDAPLYLDGHPLRAIIDGAEYFYCGYSPPYAVRVRVDLKQLRDPTAYEGFSCLVAGSRFDKAQTKLDRGPDGRLNFAWKRHTPPLGVDQQEELIKAGKMKRDEAWLHLTDIETGKPVRPHAGSVRWNDYRQRWVMIVEESLGTSNLGEVWYAEADTPIGPWVYARKVVTHDKYSFYNPVHHSFFDQDGGRLIYFEGTYAELFSGTPERTPRYDYNQMMYRLALDDSRLFLPAPVYRIDDRESGSTFMLRESIDDASLWQAVRGVEFFALPPSRRADAAIPIYARRGKGGMRLTRNLPANEAPREKPIFHALPPNAEEKHAPATVPLYEYRRDDQPDRFIYSTADQLADKRLVRSAAPLCRVWRNPMATLILDRGVTSVPIAPE
jgi:hypothetical protein